MKAVLITGANRGIGFEFVKQLCAKGFQVIATCRHPEQAKELQQLSKYEKNVVIKKLDVTNDSDISALVKELSGRALDWIINNAGISGDQGVTIGNIERDNFLQVFNTNCLSVLKVSDAFLPLLYQGQDKLIVCVSSRMGSIEDNQRGRSYAYRTSKTALNCVMRSFALDVFADGIQVMLLHPGWVKTDLGGPDATMDVETSVAKMLGVITQYQQNSHAEVLRSYDGSTIPW